MSARAYKLIPQNVPPVDTRHRRIATAIPAPGSIPIIEQLRKYEPVSMSGQPPVVWDRAEGFNVYDRFGNMWLDFSSGVLVTSAGHCHPAIRKAAIDQLNHGLMHNYCFPSEIRAELVKELARVAPEGLKKVFLLTTGAETTECAIKLARTHGLAVAGREKITIVGFGGSFHGRTLGAQMAGGIPALKQWIVNTDPAIVQADFPDGFRCTDTSFDHFLATLKQQGVEPRHVAGVMTETYQGGSAAFLPVEFARRLRKWCDENKALLIFDEVQAGFGRTGTYWGFEHYGVLPDLICCGKGITSGLPLSAIIGRQAIMDQYPPGSMTSTHSGNPVTVAATLANLRVIEDEGLVENSKRVGEVMHRELARIRDRFSDICGWLDGKGLVAGLALVKPGTIEPDADLAFDVVERCMQQGLLMFSPVGFGGGTLKICPPLVITEEAVVEGCSVIESAIEQAVDARAAAGKVNA